MNRLLVYGDSWSYGAGLDNPRETSFSAIIGQLLKLETVNFSEPGTSVDHAVYNFLTHYKQGFLKDTDRVLFCATSKARSMWFDQNACRFELHPLGIKKVDKIYYKYIYSDALAEFNLEKNILLIKLICDRLKIKSYFVNNWEAIPENLKSDANFHHLTLLGILHPERMHMTEDASGIGPIWNPSPYLFDHRHPNLEGHCKIAEELVKWIN